MRAPNARASAGPTLPNVSPPLSGVGLRLTVSESGEPPPVSRAGDPASRSAANPILRHSRTSVLLRLPPAGERSGHVPATPRVYPWNPERPLPILAPTVFGHAERPEPRHGGRVDERLRPTRRRTPPSSGETPGPTVGAVAPCGTLTGLTDLQLLSQPPSRVTHDDERPARPGVLRRLPDERLSRSRFAGEPRTSSRGSEGVVADLGPTRAVSQQ
jgi:hypothetical protein